MEQKNEPITHSMRLDQVPFAQIQKGEKQIELRLWDEKRQRIHVGDRLLFTHRETGAQLSATVTALHRFSDFAALYGALDLQKCGYRGSALATASPTDMERYYAPALQARYGVVGIEFVLTPSN